MSERNGNAEQIALRSQLRDFKRERESSDDQDLHPRLPYLSPADEYRALINIVDLYAPTGIAFDWQSDTYLELLEAFSRLDPSGLKGAADLARKVATALELVVATVSSTLGEANDLLKVEEARIEAISKPKADKAARDTSSSPAGLTRTQREVLREHLRVLDEAQKPLRDLARDIDAMQPTTWELPQLASKILGLFERAQSALEETTVDYSALSTPRVRALLLKDAAKSYLDANEAATSAEVLAKSLLKALRQADE